MAKEMTPREMAERLKAMGRYGDTELIHVNKIELGILASLFPLTIHPETGQPEAFLPLLLPFLGLTGIEAVLAGAALGAGGAALMGGDPLTGAITGAISPAAGMIAGPAMGGAEAIANLPGNLPTAAATEAITSAGFTAAPAGFSGVAGSGFDLPGVAAAAARGPLENMAGWVANNPLAVGLGATALFDSFGNKGPESSQEEYDPKKYPEQFPETQRSDIYTPAPPGYNSGTQGEWNNFGGPYGFQGYAQGGRVNQGATTHSVYDRATGRYMPGGTTSGGTTSGGAKFGGMMSDLSANPGQALYNILGGKGGSSPGSGGPQPGPSNYTGGPPIRDWRTLIAGSTGGDAVAPTPTAMPQGLSMQFSPNDFAARLQAGRPQGFADGGGVSIQRYHSMKTVPEDQRGTGPGYWEGDINAETFMKRALDEMTREEMGNYFILRQKGFSAEEAGRLATNPSGRAPTNLGGKDIGELMKWADEGSRKARETVHGSKYAQGGMVAPVRQAIAPTAGGINAMPNAQGPSAEGQLVKLAVAAISGQLQPNQAQQVIMAFIERFGEEALRDLVQRLSGGTQGRQVTGPGDGQSDSIPAQIDGGQPASLSSGEYVVPAQAVADLGNGSNDAGSQALDGMVKRASMARGGPVHPPRINPREVMPV